MRQRFQPLLALLLAAGIGAAGGSALAVAPGLPPDRAGLPVAAAAPNCVEPGKAFTGVPWAQSTLGYQRAWSLATGAGVTVAVLDSGVDGTHPQLHDRVATGADFLHGGGGPGGTRDCVGHGTAVASVIAAEPADGTGFAGVAPGARILPVTVSEKTGVTERESGDAAPPAVFGQALRWAADHGAKVVNMSVTYYTDHPEIRSAVQYAVSKDVVLVAAVGNMGEANNKNPTPYPAAYDDVIGVASVGKTGQVAAYSGHGSYVDLVAPGDAITAALPGKGHAQYDGTSVAAPFVAGAAALVRQYWPKLTAREVAARLAATASPTPQTSDWTYGHGLVDPYRAVTERLDAVPPLAQPPVVAPRVDPAVLAAQREQHRLTRWALTVAGLAVALSALVVTVAVVRRQARRTGWRPLRAPDPPPRPDVVGAAPVGLFEDGPPDTR